MQRELSVDHRTVRQLPAAGSEESYRYFVWRSECDARDFAISLSCDRAEVRKEQAN